MTTTISSTTGAIRTPSMMEKIYLQTPNIKNPGITRPWGHTNHIRTSRLTKAKSSRTTSGAAWCSTIHSIVTPDTSSNLRRSQIATKSSRRCLMPKASGRRQKTRRKVQIAKRHLTAQDRKSILKRDRSTHTRCRVRETTNLAHSPPKGGATAREKLKSRIINKRRPNRG